MNRSAIRIQGLLLFVVAMSFGRTVWAQCSDPNLSHIPSVAVQYNGPDDLGHGTLTVNYSFPNTNSGSDRIIDIVSNLAAPSNFYSRHSGLEPSGSFTINLGMTCRTGDFWIKARAVACNRWGDPNYETWSGDANASVSADPIVSVSFAGPDASGHGTLTVNYDFPNTDSPSQRTIDIVTNLAAANNNFYQRFSGFAEQSGSFTVPMNLSCRTGDFWIKARAVACDGWGNPALEEWSADANVSVSADPIVSVSYAGPDDLGHGTLTVNYNFRNTDSPSQRIIDIVTNLAAANNNFYQRFSGFATQSGSFTVPINFTCKTGDFWILARAVACDGWGNPNLEEWSNTESVPSSADPKATVSFASEDDRRHGILTVNYEFPHTDSPTQRVIDIVSNLAAPSNFYSRHTGLAQTGSFTVALNMSCRTGDYWALARAVACDGWGNANLEHWSEQETITGDHKPFLDLTPVVDPSTNRTTAILIDYDFPQTSSPDQRLIRLHWQPGGEQFAEYRPGNVKGQIKHDLPACVPRQRDGVDAYATACGDVTVPAKEPVVLSSCDFVCSIECPKCFAKPIRATNGNMRMSDSDLLPGDLVAPLLRNYDSQDPTLLRFGRGWSSVFDAFLRSYGGSDGRETVSIYTEDGGRFVFRRVAGVYGQVYPAGERVNGTLTYDGASAAFVHHEGRGAVHRIYRAGDGRLIGIREIAGVRDVSIAYTAAGLPQRVATASGAWAWDITTDASGRVGTIAVTGRPDLVWTYTYSGNQLATVTAPGGAPWRTYTYGSSGLTEARDGSGNLIESHAYDGTGRAITSGSDSDDVSGVSYNLPGRVAGETFTRVTYTSGRTTNYYSRLIAGQMRTVQVDGSCDCGTEDTVYGYDQDGRIVREQNAEGYVTLRAFDAGTGKLTSVGTAYKPTGCDPANDPVHCRLDPDSLMTTAIEPTTATEATRYQYGDPVWPDKPTAIMSGSVLAAGGQRVEQLVYHPVTGEVLRHTVTGSTDAGSGTVTESHAVTTTLYGAAEDAAFDPGGSFQSAWLALPQPQSLRKSIDGPRTDVSDATTFVHYPIDNSVPSTSRGRLAAVRNGAGHITRYESYDVFGNPTRMVDANGVATEMTYDSLGRPRTSTIKGVAGCDTSKDPLCATDLTTTRTYSLSAGALQSEQRPAGGTTTYTYDDRGRTLTTSRGPSATDLRERIEYSYDPATGKKATERLLASSSGAWTEKKRDAYSYDTFGRLRTVTHADATSIAYTYHADGRLATVRDENHASPNTSYGYDPAGRIAMVRQTLAGGTVVTRYSYDLHGNLRTVTDPNGNVTTYTYDDFGRLLREESPVTGLTTYTYNAAGDLLTRTDANGATTTRTYDVLGRTLTSISTRPGLSTETTTSAYDDGPFARGRVTLMSDPTGSTRYEYERRGMAAAENRTIGTASYATRLEYDRDGNRAKIVSPSGTVMTYGFDFAGRISSVQANGVAGATSIEYLPFGPMTELALGNGLKKTIPHDPRYRPLEQRVTSAAATVMDLRYGHDHVGNITAIDDVLDPRFSRTFHYDDLNRLTSAGTGAALWGAASYGWDAMGNPTAMTVGTRSSSISYSGTTPKIAAVVENGATRAVAYDGAGNEMSLGATSYSYSARNHLTSAGSVSFRHDGRGVPVVAAVPLGLASLSISPASVGGGATANGIVTLNAVAPVDLVVNLASSHAAATVPSSVTIPAGAAAAPFSITTSAVDGETTVEITATFAGVTKAAPLSVKAAELSAVAVTPAFVKGGTSVTGTITLDGLTAGAGAVVSLTSSNAAASVPSTVTVPAGTGIATFPVVTFAVPATTNVTITATLRALSKNTGLALQPPVLTGFTVTPANVVGGNALSAEATLDSPAASGGATVVVQSTNTTVVPTPAPITVPAGATAGQTQVATTPVAASTPVVISATHDGITRSAAVTVQPPPSTIESLVISPASLIGSNDAAGTVALTDPAPAGGIEVDLASSNAAVAATPAVITVPAGMRQATFPIRTSVVSASTVVTITAFAGPTVKTGDLTVQAPAGNYLSSLSVGPANVFSGMTATGTVTLARASADNGGSDVLLASSDATIVSVPAKATVRKNLTTEAFTVTTSSVTSSRSVTITAAYGGVVQRFTVVVLPPNAVTLASLTLNPSRVIGGNPSTGIVTLSAAAPAGGALVTLTGKRRNIVNLPDHVPVPEGQTSAPFVITTDPVHGKNDRAADITAAYNGVLKTATLVIAPAPAQAQQAKQPVARCASISIEPCLTAVALTTTATSTIERHYIYTPDLKLLAETVATAGASKPIAYDYVWLGGEPLMQIETATGTPRWYVNDHLGTPIALTDSTGAIVWRADHEPFGRIHALRAGGNLHQPLRFPGQFAVEGTELHANVFRFYRGDWGRYTQADPTGLSGGLNLYSYANQNPVRFIDPFGLIVTTVNCPADKADKIKAAADNAESLAWKCLQCGDKEAFSDKIGDLTVHCTGPELSPMNGKPICGRAANFDYETNTWGPAFKKTIVLPEWAFNQEKCGCLEAVIFHEVTHTMGWTHPSTTGKNPWDWEKKCIPCAKQQQ